jgi:aspartyl/asparaginyl-tRNA synthetase
MLLRSVLPPSIRQLLAAQLIKGDPLTVHVSGWIKSVRKQKNVAFAVISDGSSPSGLQAVFPDPDVAKRYCTPCHTSRAFDVNIRHSVYIEA